MDNQNNIPHDAFFKKWLQNQETATDFIQNFFPPQIVALLDLTTLTASSNTFVSASLKRSQSDLLYQVNLTDTNELAHIYLLFEHKSSPDTAVVFQLLRYMTRIWEKHYKKHKNFTPIIPLVFYHGTQPWNSPTSMHQLMVDTNAELACYIPQFDYLLFDVGAKPTIELQGSLANTLVLQMFKALLSSEPDEMVLSLSDLMIQLWGVTNNTELLHMVLRYLHEYDLQAQTCETIIDQLEDKGIPMPTLKEKYREQGREQGLEQGLEKGLEQGREETQKRIAKQMKTENISLQTISNITKLTPQQIKEL